MGKNYYLKDRDILDQALEHSWGKSAEAKAKEKAYNREYYQRHKEEILRKARQAGEGIQRTAQNAVNDVRTAFRTDRRYVHREPAMDTDYRILDANNIKLQKAARDRYDTSSRDAVETARTARNYHQGRGHNPNYSKSWDEYVGREANRAYDEANRAYKNASRMANRRRGSGAAVNEASKAMDSDFAGAYDKKYDSKLARDAQNAYSKLRNPKEMARRAGESTKKTFNNARDTAQNAINDVKTAFSNERRQASNPMDRNTIRPYARAHEMNDRLLGDAKQRFKNAENRVQESNARAERFRKASAANPSRASEYQKMAREAGQETYNRLNESNRAYKNQRRMANRRAASGAAYNEAAKAEQRDDWGVYDKRFDSKLARDLQNTKAKARGAMSKAEKAAQQAREDAKKRMKKWFNR